MEPKIFAILLGILLIGFISGFLVGRRRDNENKNVKVIQHTPRKFL